MSPKSAVGCRLQPRRLPDSGVAGVMPLGGLPVSPEVPSPNPGQQPSLAFAHEAVLRLNPGLGVRTLLKAQSRLSCGAISLVSTLRPRVAWLHAPGYRLALVNDRTRR